MVKQELRGSFLAMWVMLGAAVASVGAGAWGWQPVFYPLYLLKGGRYMKSHMDSFNMSGWL